MFRGWVRTGNAHVERTVIMHVKSALDDIVMRIFQSLNFFPALSFKNPGADDEQMSIELLELSPGCYNQYQDAITNTRML